MQILITGGAGYIGGMLAERIAERGEVERIICIDKDPWPVHLSQHKKITWIQANLATDNWEEKIPSGVNISHIVHTAWQIRDWYGGRETVRMWNLEGSRRVFSYAFTTPSVERLVYFSSISQYGARPENRIDLPFDESSPTRMTGYSYADDKYEGDKLLDHLYEIHSAKIPVLMIKPSTVTGPRGRVQMSKFSLASALSADANKKAIPRPIQKLLSFMPVIGHWRRQFVHEDDIFKAVECGLTSEKIHQGISSYIVSPNDVIDGYMMAELMKKRAIFVPAWIARFGFFVLWHGTRGKIATAPGVWRFMAYPIVVDGSKISRDLDFSYGYSSREAIGKLEGYYANKIEK
ncbi:MAG: NAD-dependent epimerase/dehydratase family protein [Patescibacteria group bacterium]